jgi:tetratricopeptide (TPR) repeat protein
VNHPSTQPETLLQLDSDAGPAEPLTQDQRQALIAAVMARTDLFQPASERRVRLRRGTGYWAAGALLLGGVAAAAALVRALSSSDPPPAPAVVAAAGAQASPSPEAPTVTLETAAKDAVGKDIVGKDTVAPVAAPQQSLTTRSESQEPTLKRDAALDAKGAVAPLPAAIERIARDRLEQANRLRREQRYAEALTVYLQVAADYPRSLQAQAARVAAADIKLEHLRDAAGAQQLYNAASQQGGALSEEAAFGLAESHRQTGDVKREREALERFVVSFPNSPSAPRARQRLQALGSP